MGAPKKGVEKEETPKEVLISEKRTEDFFFAGEEGFFFTGNKRDLHREVETRGFRTRGVHTRGSLSYAKR